MNSKVDYLTSSLKDSRLPPTAIVEAVDEIAADLLKTTELDPETPAGFVEGVQALQASIAASLGATTEG